MTGDVAGGRLAGRLSFRSAEDGLKATRKISLAGADAAQPAAVRRAAAGHRYAWPFGRGRRHRLEPGRADRLAARVRKDRAQRRAIRRPRSARLRCRHARGRPGAGDRCSCASPTSVGKALESGQLAVKRADGAICRQCRAGAAEQCFRRQQGRRIVAGRHSRSHRRLDRRAAGALGISSQAAGARPDIFMALKGPLAAPARSIDVSALTGWLTLRAIENQTKQLRAIENAPPPTKRAGAAAEERGWRTASCRRRSNIRPLPAPRRSRLPAASVGRRTEAAPRAVHVAPSCRRRCAVAELRTR